MKIKTVAAAATLVLGLSAAPMSLWACDMAGPNAHVGVITQINAKAHTFTIRDAQTRHLITFSVSPQMMQRLMTQAKVLVKYEKEKNAHRLKATSIKI